MQQNEMSFEETVEFIMPLNPIKIIWNDKTIIYNDYDSDNVIKVFEDGTKAYGELLSPLEAISQRSKATLEKYDIFVRCFHVDIVEHHHTIVHLYGYKQRRNTIC